MKQKLFKKATEFFLFLVLFFTISSNAQRVLILKDLTTISSGVQALKDHLVTNGMTVDYSDVIEYSFSGGTFTVNGGTSKTLADYDVIVHMNGASYTIPMNSSGQTAIMNFVRGGGGYIGGEWLSYERSNHAIMNDVILLWRETGVTQNITYNKVLGLSHPITDNLPATFTTASQYGRSPGSVSGDFSQSVTVLMTSPNGDVSKPSVAVRELERGRVVFYDHTVGNYNYGGIPYINDNNMLELYLSSIRWASGGIDVTGILCQENNSVNFRVVYNNTQDPITSYSWSITDGTTSSSSSILNKVFTVPGDYTVTVNLGLQSGGTKTYSRIFKISATPSTADAGNDISLNSGSTTATLTATTPSVGVGNWTRVSGPNSPTISQTNNIANLTGLVNGTYVFRWSVTNGTCNPSTDDITLRIGVSATLPSAPTNLSATAGNGEVEIAFTAGADGGAAITNYEYSIDGGNTWIALNPVDTTSPITISGLTNGTQYSIQIRAVNSVGAGAASTAVTSTPVTPSTININSTPVTSATVGTLYSSSVTAITTTNNPITFSVVGNLPSFLTLSSGGSSQGVQIGNSTISQASAVASDTNGNYYVVQFGGNSIFKVTSDGTVSPWATKTQSGVAVYGGAVVVGNYLYVGYRNNSTGQGGIMQYDITSPNPIGVDVVPLGSNAFFNLTYRNGFIYAGTYNTNKIIKVDLNNNFAVSDVVTNVFYASGCAFDSAGNMYITSPDGYKLWKYTTGGQLIDTGLTFTDYAFDVEIDSNDNIYIGMRGTGIRKYTPDLSSFVVINNSVGNYIWGISFGSTGTLSWAITGQNKAYQLQTGSTISGTPAIGDIGTYQITVSATDGTSTTQQNYTLSVYGPATLGAFPDITKTTNDAPFTLTAPTSNSAGAFTYTSSNTSVATISGNTVTIVGPGTATITATQAANGLYLQTTTTATLTVTAANLTTSVASLTAFSTCTGTASAEQSFTVSGTSLTGNVTVTAPTGYEVSLTSGSGFANSVTITASGTLSATIVYVRLSSSATGTPSGNITITSQGAPTQNVAVSGSITTLSATQSQTNVTCNGGSNGTASVVASGGTAPYTYSWSPSGGTAATATGLTSNIYTCTITDANNCSITRTFTITEPLAINIALAPGANTYSWAPVPGLTGVTSSETNTDMYFIDNQTGWLVGNNFIKKTTDGGVTWTTQLTGFSKMLQGVYFRSATHGWAVGANNAFFYTTDGGVNWNSVTIPGFSASMESYYDVYFTSNTVGYMVGLNFFYKSTDGGLTWTKAVNSGAKRRITVTPNNTIFVVGGTSPTVYKSTNSATSWTTTSSIGSGFGSMNDVTFIDDNIGFVCGAGGTIAKTTDAGVNWTVLTSGTTQNLYAIHFIDSNIGWATGDQNTILKTTDGGATWSLEPQQINGVSIRAIVGFSANNALAMDYGTIAKYISTASPGGVVNVSCNGGSNGQIATLVTGGTSPYTYSWSPSGGTSDTASGLSAGSYTVTVTDANNCSSTANYTVSEPALLTATQTQTNVTCNGLSDGSATVVVSGGTAPYTYAWNSNGGNGVTANNLAAGNYTCTITDANGCILIKNFTITQPSLVPSPTAPATQLFCPGATVATLQATPATGETIQWFSAPTGGTALASTTALVAGTYYAQAVNNNGCNSVSTPVVVATNNALHFDGVNDRVNLTSNSLQDGATAFTIEAWIKPDNSNWDGNWHAIFGNQTGTNVNTRNPSFYLRDGKLEVDSFEDGTLTRYYSATDQALVSQNVWNHIALVKDGTTYKIYVNGALGATTPAPNAVNITGPYQLGYIDNYYAGLLDEVRFWNVSRSQSDIQATMNVPLSGTESGLVDYYNFNQGIVGGNNTSITTLLDNTATANNGTLVGFALTGNTSNYMSGFFPQITGPNFVVAGNTITLAHPIAGGTWSSATTAVATVNASTGLVTGVSGGTAVITYTYCGQSTTYTVTVNALPTISSISNQILCANGTPAPINFVIADLETPVANLVITVTSSNAALLPVANISFAGSTGARTMNYTTIAGVFGSSTITITIDDSNGGVVTETFTVQVDPDKIETTSGIVTLEAGTPIAVDSGLVINETNTINGALVSITNGFLPGDILAYTGTLPSGVTSSYNANAGVLTFTGNMTPSEAQAILRAVTINTTSSVEQDRTVTFTLGAALPFVQNNHFYQFITAPGISWTNAKAAAEQLTFFGMQGYLTTVTSAAENQFILSKIQGQGWMGASDEQVEGVWRWMTGPEAGQQFWQGAAGGSVVNGLYNNWASGEPNNAGNEDYAHFLNGGQWNDYPLSLGSIQGYVVEFGGLANDPCVVLSASKVVEVIVNRPPTISSITSPGVVCPNTATNAISFTIDDENTPLNNLVLTAVSSNTTVVPTANIVFSGTGNNRTVVVTPAANQSGTATITITVRDSYNTTASSSFTVTFEDTTLPTVITRNITAFLDANGQTSITAAQVNNGSTDNCGIASVVVSSTNFNCSNVGPNTVTLTVTDVNGNVDTATAIVTVAYDFTTTGDNDLDGLPDNCDADDDNDGILDVNDNCPLVANANQLDTDGDGIGNTCDDDDDNDGVLDGFDNCPLTYNPDQNDRDNDGLGDVCDLIEINVAEAITPNGDGVNDTWVIYNIENHPNHAIRVFNRWGDEVFSARNYQNNWDGHYVNKSNALPSGSSYYYQIDLDGDGTVDHDGWIYITK